MSEFDGYSEGYDAGMDNSVKKLFGSSATDFLKVKIPFVKEAMKLALRNTNDSSGAQKKMLDYGCGTGEFLHLVTSANLGLSCEGVDISNGMLEEARDRHPDLAKNFVSRDHILDRFGNYSVISVVCVMHHIPPSKWMETFGELNQLLRPGGVLLVIEHNPVNPVTQHIVKSTPIDRNANLISVKHLRKLAISSGFLHCHTDYFLFAPLYLYRWLNLDKILSFTCLGGQYASFFVKRNE